MKLQETEVHACTRILGGPSDAYFGKTIGCLLGSYKARVTFEESEYLRLQPHPQYDPIEFQNLAELASIYGDQGYDGGLLLLEATCKHFYEICQARGIPLDGPNYTISYDIDIPLHLGLAETGAVVLATLRNLMHWYHVEHCFTREEFPTLAFETESEELHQTVSLQDRVVQTYGGAVFMDFSQAQLEAVGVGRYLELHEQQWPPLFLAHACGQEDSSLPSEIRHRWNEGDPQVHEAMCQFSDLAEAGKDALETGNTIKVAELLQRDLALRCELEGEAVIGSANLTMLDSARAYDLPATVCGSGAIIGILGDEPQNEAFADRLRAEGYQFLRITVPPSYPWP